MAKLFDKSSDRLTPSHTNRHNRRFRYYISRPLITNGADPTGCQVSFNAIGTAEITRLA